MTLSTQTMTDEQRKAALERSAEARRERMEFKELVKKGEISLADALADDRAKRIRVHEFLMCIPGIGKAKTDDIMRCHSRGFQEIEEATQFSLAGCCRMLSAQESASRTSSTAAISAAFASAKGHRIAQPAARI